jgi:anti-sigma factor RsiW
MEDLLLKYLDGEMSADEKKDFEKKLQSDPALQEDLKRLQLAIHSHSLCKTLRRPGRNKTGP